MNGYIESPARAAYRWELMKKHAAMKAEAKQQEAEKSASQNTILMRALRVSEGN